MVGFFNTIHWIVVGGPAEVIGVGVNHGTLLTPRKEAVMKGRDDVRV